MIRKLETTNENQVLEVEVFYERGGMNYFSGSSEPRGIYVSVSPVTESGHFRTFTAFSGIKVLALPLKRFSQKVFDAFVPDDGLILKLIDNVLSKNNLKLKGMV